MGLSLDRKDNGGDYTPLNCRWVTRSEQNSNRRNNVVLEFQGQSLNIAQWAVKTGLLFDVIQQRIKYGKWSIDRALTEQVNIKKARGHNPIGWRREK